MTMLMAIALQAFCSNKLKCYPRGHLIKQMAREHVRSWYAVPDTELTLVDRGTMGDENFCLDFISLSLSVYVFTGRGDGLLISPGKCFDPEILKQVQVAVVHYTAIKYFQSISEA